MTEPYDLVAIGSGVAATVAISRVAAAGWRTAVIDHRPFGGTCALRGCDPKKMMVSAEEALSSFRHMRGRGIDGDLRIDWPELMRFKRRFTDPIPAKREKELTKKGVDVVHGRARFVAEDELQVEWRRIRFRNVLIATGARPVPLGIPGEELVVTSDDFLELEQLPRRVLFIGGGYIAAEFSHLAARAGADVTVLQRGPRLLKNFEPDLVELLLPRFKDLGIAIRKEIEAIAVEKHGAALRVHARHAGGEERVFEADLVVHAGGRAPDLDHLDLAAGNVATERRRLSLTKHLRSTSNERVFAAGDAAAIGPPLTPVSSHDAKIVAANLLGGSKAVDYRGVPSVAFTVPAIASVGLTEKEAREQDLDLRVNFASTPDWFTARRLGETIYGHKVLIERGTDRIVGAHLVG
ncbi:MAG: NAD(P)/FAD-dependent oxidoreductase, partial [Acidobacteria bacterium]|nr:NAD(P)/FAD-dependent oxidoreductase [Acidobacteriota bacterium]